MRSVGAAQSSYQKNFQKVAQMMRDLVNGILHNIAEPARLRSEAIDIETAMEEFRSNGRETSVEPVMASSIEESLYPCSSYSSSTSYSFHAGRVFSESYERSLEIPTLVDELAYPEASGLCFSSDEEVCSFLSMDDALVENLETQQIKKTPRNRGGTSVRNRECTFCINNGESHQYYSTHYLHNPRGLITCPILYRYVCPICGATGSHAHTLNYCPLNKNKVEVPTMNVLRTKRTSTGKLRPPNYRR